ncbi:MAG TPA: hypothetical protein VN637_16815 [Roseiarcus sp.]|nr:hypothetical protein [Roseiarcus sp.]
MTHNEAMKSSGGARGLVSRRALMLCALASGLLAAFIPGAFADKLSCLPPHRLSESPAPAPANKKIGVSVAYLKVPFYANFKTGLEEAPSSSASPTTFATATVATSRLSSPTSRILSRRRRISSF